MKPLEIRRCLGRTRGAICKYLDIIDDCELGSTLSDLARKRQMRLRKLYERLMVQWRPWMRVYK